MSKITTTTVNLDIDAGNFQEIEEAVKKLPQSTQITYTNFLKEADAGADFKQLEAWKKKLAPLGINFDYDMAAELTELSITINN